MEPVKLTRADWPLIRRQALIAGLACLLGGGAALFSHGFKQQAELAAKGAQTRQQQALSVLQAAQAEEQELVSSIGPYRALTERAIIGDEQRLQWRNVLEAERLRANLPRVGYLLTPRRPLLEGEDPGLGGQQGQPENPGGAYHRYTSRMTLSLAFDDEKALVNYLEGVMLRANALTVARSCWIARKGEEGGQAQQGQGLVAECKLDWVTLERASDGVEGQP